MRITDLLDERSICLNGSPTSKEDALNQMVALMVKSGNIKDEEAYKTAKDFAAAEGVLIGISAGAAIYGAIKIARELGKGKKVLAIAPDGGEKYISMGLFD